MPRATKEYTGHKDSEEEQREYLASKHPSALRPLKEFSTGEPGPEHNGQGDEEGSAYVPLVGEYGSCRSGIIQLVPVGENKDSDHGGEVEGVLGQSPRLGRVAHGEVTFILARKFLLVVDQVHSKADDYAEGDCANSSGQTELRAKYPSGKDDGQNVNRRAGVKKRSRWSNTSSPRVDTGEQGQYGA